MLKRRAAGFTIVELMIATAVFAVVLLVITAGVLQFSRSYYQGVIAGRTQNVARQLMDDVTHDIEFEPGTVSDLTRRNPHAASGTIVGYCIGQAHRYSFALNTQVTTGSLYSSHQGPHGLLADTTSGCTSATASLDPTSPTALTTDPNTGGAPINARELLGEHMRLVNFSITSDSAMGSGAYDVDVRVVYGDDDLLCSPSAGTCDNATHPASSLNGRTDIQCKPIIHNEFCAAAEFTTTVKKRVN